MMTRCPQDCPMRCWSPEQASQALELLETLLHMIFEVHHDSLVARWGTVPMDPLDMPPVPEDCDENIPF
jgi:hypothetical protein